MRKLSEVRQIVGITRRTLQEYDRIKLVCPTDKTEGGYWLYDDEAILKLILIQVFIEAGYERKAIKKLLESPKLDLVHEYDELIEKLSAKRKRINGMINSIKMIKLSALLPESIAQPFGKVDLSKIYLRKSFSESWNESIDTAADFDDLDSVEAKQFLPLMSILSMLGYLQGEEINSRKVQDCVRSLIEYIMKIAHEDNDTEEIIGEKEGAEVLLELVTEILSDPEKSTDFNEYVGEGATDFIVKAIRAFYENVLQNCKNEKEGKH